MAPAADSRNNQLKEFSLDFVEVLPHISQEIFGYLDVNDLLECSLVSKEWNKLIGTTPECMDKIEVVINKDTESEAKKLLSMSSRLYQHIEIYDASIDQIYADFFKKSEGNWRTVVIKSSGILLSEHFYSILKSIEPTIEELNIIENKFTEMPSLQSSFKNLKVLAYEFTMRMFAKCKCCCKTDSESLNSILKTVEWTGEELNFKNLKGLSVGADEFPLHIFARCKNLMLLEVSFCGQHDAVRQLLIDNADLEDVLLVSEEWKNVFDDNLCRNVTFKLDTFQVESCLTEVSPFMVSFLNTQFGTLKELTLNGIDLNSLEVIFRMPKLEKLLIFIPDDWLPNWSEVVLPQNSSIEFLQLHHSQNNDVAIAHAFVRALPNIKKLTFTELNDDLFTYLSENVPNLESICCGIFELSPGLIMAGNPLPNLKNLEYLEYDGEDLQQLLAEPANNFQRLLRDFQPPVE